MRVYDKPGGILAVVKGEIMSNKGAFWDDGTPPIPLLKKGDKPFTNDDERTAFDKEKGHANSGFYKEQPFYGYAQEYISAADKLVQTVDGLLNREKYVLPIVFLYRHFIELKLKSILCEEYKGHKKSSVPMTHRIDELWDKVRKVLEPVLMQYKDNGMLAEVEAAEEFIKEFAAVDAMSESFRYPIDTKGQPTLKGNSLLQHIADKMASLDAFLGDAFTTLFFHYGNVNKLPQDTTP
jgi:hypothetical protein